MLLSRIVSLLISYAIVAPNLADFETNVRSLLDVKKVKKGDPDYDSLSVECADYLYEGFLVVDEHFFVIGSPLEDARAAGCPYVDTHAVYDEETKQCNKEAVIWNSESEAKSFMQQSLSIGSFKASAVAQAFETTDPNYIVLDDTIDLVPSYCPDYLLNLAAALKVPIDSIITTYVAKRLFQQSGKHFMDKIKQSKHYFDIFHPNRYLRALGETPIGELTDAQAIEILDAVLKKRFGLA